MSDDIVDYRPSDQDDILSFFENVLTDLGFDFDVEGKDADLQRIAEVYQSTGGVFLTWIKHGCLRGTIALRQIDENIGELKRFYVRREHRGLGIGTALLNRAISHAQGGRWRRLRLDTSRKSPAAIALFRKKGFVEIPRYNDDPFAEIFMELTLP